MTFLFDFAEVWGNVDKNKWQSENNSVFLRSYWSSVRQQNNYEKELYFKRSLTIFSTNVYAIVS